MKFTTKALLLAGALLAVASGCGNKGDEADSAPSPTQYTSDAPTPIVPAAPAPSPDPTQVNGKTVRLKSTPSGLKYYDMKVGTGPSPQSGQIAVVKYTGRLLNGAQFDSTDDHPGGAPFEFPVGGGQVIKGWDEGVATMKVGGKRRLVVPADLAYGDNPPTPAIPPNATLVFDIELVSVK